MGKRLVGVQSADSKMKKLFVSREWGLEWGEGIISVMSVIILR